MNYKIIFALTLVHFTGDLYSSFITPLIPEFVDKLSLSLAQVGLMTGIVRLLAFVVQPLIGYYADRYETRFFILCGLFFVFFFTPLSGIAPNFIVLIIVLSLGSIGSSMFHPSTTGMIPLYSGPKASFSLSIFNTGGTFAFAIGPVFIAWYVTKFGLSKMPYTMIFGLVLFLYLFKTIPVPISEKLESSGFIGSIKETLGDVMKPIFLIWVVMFLRAVTGQTFITFMPIHLSNNGHGLMSIGFIVAMFIFAGTLSGLIGGYFSDKIGFKKIFFVSHALMLPTLLLYLYLPGNFVYLGAFLAGFSVLASLPLGVAMAQKLAPKSRSMVSSLMMGFAYGLGGAISPFIGKLADIYGLEIVLFCISFVPLITLIFIAKFPNLEN
ncbi:MAG: MFS transporter [Desulfobacteraceae bacterium]|nr:MFS transporter [Desulfobacteraceae bacterium]